MGNTQAQTVDGVTVRSMETEESLAPDALGGHVRVTLPKMDSDRAVQEAYEKGKAEGQAAIQSMLEAVAADVYDNVHGQLAELQKKQVEKAKQMAAGLKVKISTVKVQRQVACAPEHSALLSCMRTNGQDLLSCQQLIEQYSSCAKDLN